MLIDVDALRKYLLDLCGTAALGGFAPALVGVAEVEGASPEGLLRIAENMGVDLEQFSLE